MLEVARPQVRDILGQKGVILRDDLGRASGLQHGPKRAYSCVGFRGGQGDDDNLKQLDYSEAEVAVVRHIDARPGLGQFLEGCPEFRCYFRVIDPNDRPSLAS